MDTTVTVEQALEAAVAAERAMETLFHGLEAKFAPFADLAAFWKEYALEEVMHARWLESVRARLKPDQLAAPVPEDTVAALRAVADFSVEHALSQVKNLEEAYALVMTVENGETNVIFHFVLDHFEPNDQTANFLRAQLNSHILKLVTSLPAPYQSSAAQRAIQAVG